MWPDLRKPNILKNVLFASSFDSFRILFGWKVAAAVLEVSPFSSWTCSIPPPSVSSSVVRVTLGVEISSEYESITDSVQLQTSIRSSCITPLALWHNIIANTGLRYWSCNVKVYASIISCHDRAWAFGRQIRSPHTHLAHIDLLLYSTAAGPKSCTLTYAVSSDSLHP